jgi:hypothetical protein
MQNTDYIQDNYLTMSIGAIARELGRSSCYVVGKMRKLGIVVPEQIREQRKQQAQFKKGQNPWNAGRTGVRHSLATEFKKGSLPANTKHDGAISIRNDRSTKTGIVRQYKYIRLTKGKWILLQRYVWQQHYGEVPAKHVVVFLDGDTMNCEISNLSCISMAENARRNHNHTKSKNSHLARIEDGDLTPSQRLTDVFVAGLITKGDKKLRKKLLKNNKELVAIKKTSLMLNRQIKEHAKRK